MFENLAHDTPFTYLKNILCMHPPTYIHRTAPLKSRYLLFKHATALKHNSKSFFPQCGRAWEILFMFPIQSNAKIKSHVMRKHTIFKKESI